MTHRRTRILTIALAAAAVTSPAAASQPLRSPDTRDQIAKWTSTSKLDLRSPDTRDLSAQPARGNVDLRSPDAADPYSGVPVKVVASAPVIRQVDTGFRWGDAATGAGILFALVLLLKGGSAITRRHNPAMR